MFSPPGEVIESYEVNGNTYTVYRASLRDPSALTLVSRLQILVLLFVEGGTYIDTSDDRWQIYILCAPCQYD